MCEKRTNGLTVYTSDGAVTGETVETRSFFEICDTQKRISR